MRLNHYLQSESISAQACFTLYVLPSTLLQEAPTLIRFFSRYLSFALYLLRNRKQIRAPANCYLQRNLELIQLGFKVLLILSIQHQCFTGGLIRMILPTFLAPLVRASWTAFFG